MKTIKSKRPTKGIEISHWKVGEADDFQGIEQEEYGDLKSVVPEGEDLDQRKEI